MKKSVLHFFKVLIAGLVLLCLSSCTGLIQKTGSVSFEIGPDLLNAARAGGDPDEEFVRIVVALEGKGYGIKQTVDIPIEQYWDSMATDRRFEATFDNIPVGKKLYAVIKTYQMMPGNNLPLELRDPELYGKSDYFTVKSGQNKVSINASDYLRLNPYAYNNTPLVLYNYNKDTSKYDYTIDRMGGVTSTSTSFCFDDQGNVYSIYNNSIVANFHMGLLPLTDFNPKGITFDTVTKKIYVYALNEATLNLCDVTDVVTEWDSTMFDISNVKSINFSESGNDLSNFYHKKIAINNDILYDIGRNNYGNGNIFLVTQNINNISSPETTADSIIALSDRLLDIQTGEINDIIYLDGSIYFLINHFGNTLSGSSTDSPYGYYSRGALVKYNISDGRIRTLGWTSEPINNSGKYIYICASYGGEQKLYEDSNCLIPFKVSAKDIEGKKIGGEQILFPSFYAPAGKNNTSHFYGPQKIIGIKPKKLIIADNGVAFYTDSDNAYKAKNVNRIVTVDLEAFAITNVADAPNGVTFEPDLTGDINTSAFAYVKNIMEVGKTYYESEGVEYVKTSENAALYAYIPLEQ